VFSLVCAVLPLVPYELQVAGLVTTFLYRQLSRFDSRFQPPTGETGATIRVNAAIDLRERQPGALTEMLAYGGQEYWADEKSLDRISRKDSKSSTVFFARTRRT
jgi:hypothetical protein